MAKRVNFNDKYKSLKGNDYFGDIPKKSNIKINYKIILYVTDEDMETVKVSSEDLREGNYDVDLLTKGVEHIRKKYNGKSLKVDYLFQTGKLRGELSVSDLFIKFEKDIGKMIYKLLIDIDDVLRASTTRFEFLIRYYLLKTLYKDKNFFSIEQGKVLSETLGGNNLDYDKFISQIDSVWKSTTTPVVTYGKVVSELEKMPVEVRNRDEPVKGLGVMYIKVGVNNTLNTIKTLRRVMHSKRVYFDYMDNGFGVGDIELRNLSISNLMYFYIIVSVLESRKRTEMVTAIKGITGDLYPLSEDSSRTKSGADLIYKEGLISYEDFESVKLDVKYKEIISGMEGISVMIHHPNLLVELNTYFRIGQVTANISQIFHVLYSTSQEFRDYVNSDSQLDKSLKSVMLYDTINNSYAINKVIGFVKSGNFVIPQTVTPFGI